jgi:Na+/proline symporter
MRTEVAFIVGIYFSLLIGWSIFNFIKNYRQGSSQESLYVGERNYGFGHLLATLVAAWASNYTLLAAAESGFRNGISGPIWYAFAVAVPIFLFIWPINLVEKIREMMPDGLTLVEFVGKRYDEKSRLVSLVIILLSSILYIISVVMAIGIVLASLLNIDTQTATLIGGIILVLYTALGGFETIVWSHVYQLVLAGLSVIVALVLTIREVGLTSFVEKLPAEQFNVLAWGPVSMVDFFLVLIAFTIANPIIWQRIFSAKDAKEATRAIKWFGPTWAPFAVGSGLMGMASFILIPSVDPSQAATRLVIDLFPNWAAVLFLLGGMALVFSSGDAAVNNVASIVQFDIIKKYYKKTLSSRQNLYLGFALQIILGAIGIIGALKFTSILSLLVINSAVNIALLFPLYFGITWKQANSNAAFWSMILAVAVGALTLSMGPVSNLSSTLTSFIIFFALTYFTKSKQSEFEGMNKGGSYRA